MAKEVERKFLVSRSDWRQSAEPGIAIVQFYIASTNERSVRVRIRKGTEATLTIKFGGDKRIRDEFEYPIPPDEAREMKQFAIGALIEKTRHLVRHRGHVYEVDVFGGALPGLVVAELETEAEVPDEMLPPWLGREVTGRAEYYNASLARHGLPELIR
jgi:CYTH domain-containing protein